MFSTKNTIKVRTLFCSLGILLSLNCFAETTTPLATQKALNTEITKRKEAVAAEVNARGEADNKLQSTIDSEVASQRSINDDLQSQLDGLQAQLDALPNFFSIGETGPAGGIVFFITEAGAHGLEAAPKDQESAQWGCFGTRIIGASGTAIGTGGQNTAAILAGCDSEGTAAKIADAYSFGGFDDWYLPAKDELFLLYSNLHLNTAGGFENDIYWNSTQGDRNANASWFLNFSNGDQNISIKVNSYRVRAIRAF